MGIWDDYKAEFDKTNNALIQFILVNVSVFVVISLLGLFGLGIVGDYLHLPSNLGELLLKPWTVVTYAFMHAGIGHILMNMMGLYWFGRIIADLVGNSKLISLYFLGGVAAAIAFVLIYNLNPKFAGHYGYLVGASGSVFAIAVAAATLVPDYRFNLIFLGPVKISYIVAVYVFMSILGTQGGNAGGNYAHLGGALLGWFYIKQLQQGNDLGKPVFAVIDFFKSLFKKKDKLKVSYSAKKRSASSSSPAVANSDVSQVEIDKILDKISQSGYESLSKEEKKKLFSASQKK